MGEEKIIIPVFRHDGRRIWERYAEGRQYAIKKDLLPPGFGVTLRFTRCVGRGKYRYKVLLKTPFGSAMTTDYKDGRIRDYSLSAAKEKARSYALGPDWLEVAGVDLDRVEFRYVD